MGLYNWLSSRFSNIGVGTGNITFQPGKALPVQTAIGPAVAVRRLRTVTQPPGIFMGAPFVTTSGLGGLQHGVIVFQPLVQNP